MRLSPWEPPRLLWAAIEGVLGVVHSIDGFVVQPLVPPGWKWVAVRRLAHAGREETMFLARQGGQLHIYCDIKEFTTDLPHTDYDCDVSDRVHSLHPDANVVALSRENELLICVGSSADQTITAPLQLSELLEVDLSYYVEVYDSELQDWVRGVLSPAQELAQVATPVEAGGFHLFRLIPVRL